MNYKRIILAFFIIAMLGVSQHIDKFSKPSYVNNWIESDSNTRLIKGPFAEKNEGASWRHEAGIAVNENKVFKEKILSSLDIVKIESLLHRRQKSIDNQFDQIESLLDQSKL